MKHTIKDTKAWKTGTDYISIKVSKHILNKMPDGFFFMDLIIEETRGGKHEKEK